jgi:Lamin-B receptor of TUDOR domain
MAGWLRLLQGAFCCCTISGFSVIFILNTVGRSKYSLGWLVAKRFHGSKFERELLGYDATEEYYLIFYKDGDCDELELCVR